ncbi:MAG TPA: DNA-formamidopyrimidine glycosylase family protein [Micrococcaceae bacterium]
MPEGHSVHRLARQFGDVFTGARLSASSPQGRFAAGSRRIDGRVLESARAHGKQLFLRFDNDLVLRTHLGLYGAWDFGGDESFSGASSIGAPRRIGEREIPDVRGPVGDRPEQDGPFLDGPLPDGASPNRPSPNGRVPYAGPPEPVGAVRVRLVSDHGWADLRGPTACEVITTAEAAAAVALLGPDPLHNAPADRTEFGSRLGARGTAIALLLMDQKVLAGVGNVYRAEVLFRQRLDPWMPGSGLSARQLGDLWQDIAAAMSDGARDGRIITTLPRHRVSGDLPVPVEEAHYVYKRHGQPCRICGTDIALTELANRKLYWCPGCQR